MQPFDGALDGGDQVRATAAGAPDKGAGAADIGAVIERHVVGGERQTVEAGRIKGGQDAFALGVVGVGRQDGVRVDLLGKLVLLVVVGYGGRGARAGAYTVS